MELFCRVSRAEAEGVHCRRLDTLKEVAVLASQDSQAIIFVQKKDTWSPGVKIFDLIVLWTDNDKAVVHAQNWAVIARPAKRACMLLCVFRAQQSLHIGLHDEHVTSIFRLTVHRNHVFLRVQSHVLDLTKRLWLRHLSIRELIFFVISQLALVTVVNMAQILFDEVEALCRVCHKKLYLLGLAFLSWQDKELDLQIAIDVGKPGDLLEL